MLKRPQYILLGIFLLTLTVRLTLAFFIPNFTYDSYFHLRQVEAITNTGLPHYQDPLSYGGRELVFLPLFHYLMAFFNLFLPLELIAKIIPNLLFASLTIIIYLISKKITQEENSALFSAFIAGFLPILFTPNSFHPLSLFFPLMLLCLYAFLNLEEKKYLYLYLVSFLGLSLTSSAASLLLVGFCVYLLLSFLENKKVKPAELEIILFSVFLYVWLQFLFLKNVLLREGWGFIWQNIPEQIITQYFPLISIPEALVLVSIIPFLAGIYVVYRSLFQLKSPKIFLLLSLVIATTFLAWFRLIEFRTSLTLFGLVLTILFASFYQNFTGYLQRTKLSQRGDVRKIFSLILFFLILFSLIYPAVMRALDQDTPSPEEVQAFQSLPYYASEDSAALASLKEGHLVTYYGKVKNIMDDQFALIGNSGERFKDLKALYTTKFETEALRLLDKYQVDYLILTPSAQEEYGVKKFNYLTSECFELKYKNETKVYYRKCQLQKKD